MGGGGEDKFKAMWNLHGNSVDCHGGKGDFKLILTRGMCQLLDNSQGEKIIAD